MSLDPVEPRDELLDRAVRAVRELPVPDGPSPLLMERTRVAMRQQAGREPLVPARLFRWAAVVLLTASAGAAVLVGGKNLQNRLAQNVPAENGAAKQPSQDPAATGDSKTDGTVAPATVQPVRLAGKVRLEGPAPLQRFLPSPGGPHCSHHHAPPKDESIVVADGGGLANVVVAISEGLPANASFTKPAAPAVLDQKDCKYLPRVVTMQVGQELVAKNSDPFFHNVHTNSMANKPVNVAQPQPDPIGLKLKSIETAETFKVTCDLHPWMIAWVAAFDHPFHAVTNNDGSFEMPPLPPGTYTVKAWHERLGAVERQVVVGADGKVPAVEFQFTQEHLAAALADRIPTASAAGGLHAGPTLQAGTATDAVPSLKPNCCENKKD